MTSGVKCRQYRYALLPTLYTCKRGALLPLLTPLKVKTVSIALSTMPPKVKPDTPYLLTKGKRKSLIKQTFV